MGPRLGCLGSLEMTHLSINRKGFVWTTKDEMLNLNIFYLR